MLQNYFTIALRSLIKRAGFSITNILGLSLAIACCLLLTLYVTHELSYDNFHDKSERIFRVTMEYGPPDNVQHVAYTGTRVLPEFLRTFPEVENGVRFFSDDAIIRVGTELRTEQNFVYADSSLFNIFSFELLEGDPATALNSINSILLTQSKAKSYFGDQSPLGEVIHVDNEHDYVVTGVVENPPTYSQIKFDFIAPFAALEASKTEEWWDASYYTYFLLQSPDAAAGLEAQIPTYMKTHYPENGFQVFHFEKLRNVHLSSDVEGGFEPAGDVRYIYILIGVALLILAIACTNYINLTTAMSADRAREVGVRKVMGAQRRQLIIQFISESILTVIASLIVGTLIARLLLPMFNNLSNRSLEFRQMFEPVPLLVIAGIAILIGLLGGGYPSLVMSGFQPVRVLKGAFRNSDRGVFLRRALIVFQFMISLSLVSATLVIHEQLGYIQSRKLGFDKEHVISLPIDDDVLQKLPAIRTELLSDNRFLGVSSASRTPVEVNSTITMQFGDRSLLVNQIRVDREYISTMGMHIVAGQDFSPADETNPGESLILNETAIQTLGLDLKDAIGKTIGFRGKQASIKGVVEDFHFTSMHTAIAPMILFTGAFRPRLIVKLSGHDLPGALNFLQKTWTSFAPHRPFEYQFLDDQFDKLYESERRTSGIFYAFAILAIGLACLGLMSLSAYMARQRVKEISIRKVLGASVTGIIALLSSEFLKLIAIGVAISAPLCYLALDRWLKEFAYRLHFPWVTVVLGSLAVVVLSMAVTGFQSLSAASSNPADTLRSE